MKTICSIKNLLNATQLTLSTVLRSVRWSKQASKWAFYFSPRVWICIPTVPALLNATAQLWKGQVLQGKTDLGQAVYDGVVCSLLLELGKNKKGLTVKLQWAVHPDNTEFSLCSTVTLLTRFMYRTSMVLKQPILFLRESDLWLR